MLCPNLLDFSILFQIFFLPSIENIGQNWHRDISNFLISGQFLINKNLHNSRTTNDIDMKLRPESKLDKKNTKTSNVLTMTFWIKSASRYIIVVYSIYQKFGAIRKPASVSTVCNTYIFINSKLLSYKICEQN